MDFSEEDFFLQTSAISLVQLTQGAVAIEIPERAPGFILWLFDRQPHPGLRPFTAFCALALASVIGFGNASEEEIVQVCNWVDAEEERCRTALGNDCKSARWLIGINSYEGLRHSREKWLLVAKQVFEHPQKARSAKVRAALPHFSDRLAGE